MSRWLQLRVFAFTIVIAVSVGALVASVLLIASDPPNAQEWFISPETLAALAVFSILAAVPFSVVGAVVGAILATRAIRTSRELESRGS